MLKGLRASILMGPLKDSMDNAWWLSHLLHPVMNALYWRDWQQHLKLITAQLPKLQGLPNTASSTHCKSNGIRKGKTKLETMITLSISNGFTIKQPKEQRNSKYKELQKS